MKLYRLFSLAALAVLLPGCADVVRVTVTKPPQLDLGGIRKLKLDKFAITGRSNGTNSELSVESLVADLASKAPAVDGNASIQEAQRSGLAELLAGNRYVQVSKGPDQQATLGGVIDYQFGDNIYEHKRHNAATNTDEEVYTLTRSASVSLDFTVTAPDGRVLARSSAQGYSSETQEGASELGVRHAAGSDATSLVYEALSQANGKLACMLAPCSVVEERTLRGGRSGDIGKGNKAAHAGQWDAAAAIWRSSADPASRHTDIRLAALHNLGVYFEVKGDLMQALDSYQQVYATSHKPYDKAEVTRVTQAIRDDARLNRLLAAKDEGKHAAPGKK